MKLHAPNTCDGAQHMHASGILLFFNVKSFNRYVDERGFIKHFLDLHII